MADNAFGKVPSLIDEAPDAHMPEGENVRVQWRHYDELSKVVGDAAISAMKATDFRERAFWQHRERTLDEVLRILLSALPDERGEGEPVECPGCTEYNESPTRHAPPLCAVRTPDDLPHSEGK